MDRRKYKEPVDIIDCGNGLVNVIHPDTGIPTTYCVRGAKRFSKEHREQWAYMVQVGLVSSDILSIPELPNIWDCTYERPDIMGKPMLSIRDYAKMLEG